ncbi:MAG: insulinase family protein [Desulfobacula sp.]|nr:insulinase family protein [Desulfobacula sp.]
MKYKSIVVKIVLAGLLLILSCAPKHNFIINSQSVVPVDPDIVYGHLPNGFQYILMENTTPKERINIHLNIFSGSMHETDEQQGTAHYLEHLLFNGSTHFPPGDLIKYFQSIGMDFGADANAHTSFFNTVYDLTLPDNTRQHLDKAFLIIEDYAQGALLLEPEVERERGVVLSEKRQRDSISYRTFKKSLEFEIPGSLLNKRFPIGIEKVLNKADSNLLKSYYDLWYRPDNMALVVVGDFNAKLVESMIVKRFSKLKPRTSFSRTILNTKFKDHKGVEVFYHHEPEASSTDVTIETVVWKPFEQLTIDNLKKTALNNITNAIIQNRLSRMVNKQTASFSQASAYSGSFLHNISLSAINAECDPDSWPECLQQIENVLRQAIKFGFTKKELDRVKADSISLLERQLNQAQTRKTRDLSRQILATINKKGLFLSEKQRKNLLKPYIESITTKDVHQALKEIWSEDHRLLMVTGNADINTDNPETMIREVFNKSINKRVDEYKGFESKKFPYLSIPSSFQFGIKTKVDNIKDLGITKIEFENNISLNLKKTDFKKNEFKFKVCFGQGKKSQPAAKPGLSIICESVINKSGFGSLDADQLEEALAGRDINIGFEIDENNFSLSGSADPKEAELIFQLIYHYFNDPGFSQEALDLAKIRYKQSYEALMLTPEGIMQIKGDAFLAKNDHRFGLPHPDIIDQYTLDDIKNWIMPNFANPFIDVSMVGDFDSQNLVKLALKYMGTLKPRKEIDNKSVDSAKVNFPKGERLELIIDSKIHTGVIHLAFLTDDFWDIQQTRRLAILSRVLSERLRILIREELSETYSPYAYNDPSLEFDDYGVMHIVVNVQPERIEFVHDKIKEVVESLTLKAITQQETQVSLKPVLNHLKIIRRSNAYWLNSVMANSANFPQKFEWANNILNDYAAITHDDLNQLVKKYINIDQSALIIIKSGK